VKRREDDSPNGYLRVIQGPDGDIYVTVHGRGRCGDPLATATVRFCTSQGGGHSHRTLNALRELMTAMKEDFEGNSSSVAYGEVAYVEVP
jgi:hypothetical protein